MTWHAEWHFLLIIILSKKKDLHNIITPQDCRLSTKRNTKNPLSFAEDGGVSKTIPRTERAGFFPPHHCPKRWGKKIACQGHWPGPIPSGTSTLISWVWPSIAIALRKTPGKETRAPSNLSRITYGPWQGFSNKNMTQSLLLQLPTP